MNGTTYITGDMHGDMGIRRLGSSQWSEGKNLTRDDYLIVAGDMGIL